MNPSDSRKNMRDLLSAFLLAFREPPRRDPRPQTRLFPSPRVPRAKALKDLHASLGITHLCRVIALTDYLDEDQMDDLIRYNNLLCEHKPRRRRLFTASEGPRLRPARDRARSFRDGRLHEYRRRLRDRLHP